MDIYGAFQLCSIGILAAPVTVMMSRTFFNDPGRNIMFLWTLLVLVGELVFHAVYMIRRIDKFLKVYSAWASSSTASRQSLAPSPTLRRPTPSPRVLPISHTRIVSPVGFDARLTRVPSRRCAGVQRTTFTWSPRRPF